MVGLLFLLLLLFPDMVSIAQAMPPDRRDMST